MDMIFDAAASVLALLGSLMLAALLCWTIWRVCIRLRCPQGSGLIVGNLAAIGLLAIPHGSFLTLALAYAAAAACPIWIAGRESARRQAVRVRSA